MPRPVLTIDAPGRGRDKLKTHVSVVSKLMNAVTSLSESGLEILKGS
jgi:hypothetical protein